MLVRQTITKRANDRFLDKDNIESSFGQKAVGGSLGYLLWMGNIVLVLMICGIPADWAEKQFDSSLAAAFVFLIILLAHRVITILLLQKTRLLYVWYGILGLLIILWGLARGGS